MRATCQPVTTRGFTGHEMAEDFGIINMNGRIYDPLLGRFLQADSFIDGAKNTQGYNRYSYVHNNPLNATDPSGFLSLGGIFKAFAIVAISAFTYGAASTWAVGAYGAGCVTACSLATASILGGIAGGAAAGFVGAALGAAFNGANFGQALKAGIQGGFAGGFSGGVTAGLTGGTAGNTTAGSNGVLANRTPIEKMIVEATIRGTASEITGGNFANSARTAFYSSAIQSAVALLAPGGGTGESTFNSEDACSYALTTCTFGQSGSDDVLEYTLKLYGGLQRDAQRVETVTTAVSIATGVGALVRGAGMLVEKAAASEALTAGKIFFRSMSKAEAEAIKNTGKLRGGNPGENFFTDSRFRSADLAKDRLSLPNKPEVQLEFRITNNPTLERSGTRVAPDYGGRGGGKEFMTRDSVNVEIINVQPY